MQVNDKIVGVRRMGFEEKQNLPNHDFRGKECFEITLANFGTVIVPLDGPDAADVCKGMAEGSEVSITLNVVKADA